MANCTNHMLWQYLTHLPILINYFAVKPNAHNHMIIRVPSKFRNWTWETVSARINCKNGHWKVDLASNRYYLLSNRQFIFNVLFNNFCKPEATICSHLWVLFLDEYAASDGVLENLGQADKSGASTISQSIQVKMSAVNWESWTNSIYETDLQ